MSIVLLVYRKEDAIFRGCCAPCTPDQRGECNFFHVQELATLDGTLQECGRWLLLSARQGYPYLAAPFSIAIGQLNGATMRFCNLSRES